MICIVKNYYDGRYNDDKGGQQYDRLNSKRSCIDRFAVQISNALGKKKKILHQLQIILLILRDAYFQRAVPVFKHVT